MTPECLAVPMQRVRALRCSPIVVALGVFAIGCSALTSVIVWAQEEGSHASAHGFHEPFHTLGVFIGNTSEDRRAERGVTFGFEYEYRAVERFGLGFIAEHVAGDLETVVYVIPAAFHKGAWKMYAGPGLEYREGGEEKLFRVGVEYGFHLGKFEVSPQVDLDFVDGQRLFVLGVVFARKL